MADKRLAVLVSHGSFNPVHRQHLEMMVQARRALESAGFQVVRGILAITNRRRMIQKRVAPITDRHRMAALHRGCNAVAGVVADASHSWLVPDARGVNFTSGGALIQALQKELQAEFPRVAIFNVLGGDTASRYHRRGFAAPTVVVQRAGHSHFSKQVVQRSRPDELFLLEALPGEECSSTRLRKALEQGNAKDVYDMCPQSVAEYLLANTSSLYGGGDSPLSKDVGGEQSLLDKKEARPANSRSSALPPGLVIGVSGATRCGKSTLARGLQDAFGGEGDCVVIAQDDYRLGSRCKTPDSRVEKGGSWLANWETPNRTDWQALERDVIAAASASTNRIVIVEGFCLLYSDRLCQSLRGLVWLDVDEETCRRRRSAFPRGWDRNAYFSECIWPAHLHYAATVFGGGDVQGQTEKECAKVPGLDAAPGPLDTVGVVGAGLMGGGIAMCCAEAGMRVTILDVDAKALERGMETIRKNYARSVERKSKTQAQVDGILGLITASTNYGDFKDCDIMVEAVFENMKVKQEIFKQLDQVCRQGCVLASNTSALNIDKIAEATSRPQDVIGCHFFSPANVMRLLENVRGAKSSPRTIATAMAFGVKIKKVTCLVGNCDGFVANRVMGRSGADVLLHRGAAPKDIDAACESFGMKMGPFKMADLVGLDLFGRERAQAKVATPEKNVRDAMYAAGRYGQKNGKGFYKYDSKRQLSADPEADAIIAKVWSTIGVSATSFSPDEIVQTCYFPVINEGFKCLEEGIAIRPCDVDVCLVFGYNWPRATGGPMHFASSVGLPKVLDTLEKMKVKPANLLKECVEKGWTMESEGLKQRLAQVRSKL